MLWQINLYYTKLAIPPLFLHEWLKQYYSQIDGNIKYKNKFSHNLTTVIQMLLPQSVHKLPIILFYSQKNVCNYQQFVSIRGYPPKVGRRLCSQLHVKKKKECSNNCGLIVGSKLIRLQQPLKETYISLISGVALKGLLIHQPTSYKSLPSSSHPQKRKAGEISIEDISVDFLFVCLFYMPHPPRPGAGRDII